MSSSGKVRVAMIGCGGMARGHVRNILKQQDTTEVIVVNDPSDEAYAEMQKVFTDANLTPPPNEKDLTRLLSDYQGRIDVAFIVTPHAFHYEQAKACMEAGLDVLLEKPMVVTAAEAESLIQTRDATGKLLVIAFNGSLSHQIRTASGMIASGEVGKLQNIVAYVWEDWSEHYNGHWKQVPEISGGGFMFDTGAHMLNTVSDLANQDFVEVAAWLDNRGKAIDILGCVMGRLESGALVTMNSCGNAIHSCASEIRLFCTEAIIRTGIWGEYLEIQREGEKQLQPVPVPASLGAWEQFYAVRSGKMKNPSPPEIGLRMAKLWDAIRASAAQNGVPVRLK
ncbi:MAG: gfo/Idh/MocA family oxidoreductase [Anaerolineaceae bacterium]|nr:gfo/Idh/MocA family oxidoreductase [Anaerolineaceae bacterium]